MPKSSQKGAKMSKKIDKERYTQILVDNPDIQGLITTVDDGKHLKLRALYGFKGTRACKYISRRIAKLNEIMDEKGAEFLDDETLPEDVSDYSEAPIKYNWRGAQLSFSRKEAKNVILALLQQL